MIFLFFFIHIWFSLLSRIYSLYFFSLALIGDRIRHKSFLQLMQFQNLISVVVDLHFFRNILKNLKSCCIFVMYTHALPFFSLFNLQGAKVVFRSDSNPESYPE
jgi:hypothetical protein